MTAESPISTLTDARVISLLESRQTLAELPEFQPVIAHYHATKQGVQRGGCSGCARRRQQASAVRQAHSVLLSLPADRFERAKQLMGLTGRIRIYERVGNTLVPRVR